MRRSVKDVPGPTRAELEEHELGHDNFEDSLTALMTNNSNLGKPPSVVQ